MSDRLDHCLTVPELAARWRCRVGTVRSMVKRGTLPAIDIGGRLRIAPEAILEAERGPLAVKPARRRKREVVPTEVLEMLGG